MCTFSTLFFANSTPAGSISALAHASEIEVRFEALGPRQTRVSFLHRGIERHGEGYQALRDQLDQGWVGVLAEYAKLAEGEGMNAPATAPAAVSGAP
jgi:hypothetical protein